MVGKEYERKNGREVINAIVGLSRAMQNAGLGAPVSVVVRDRRRFDDVVIRADVLSRGWGEVFRGTQIAGVEITDASSLGGVRGIMTCLDTGPAPAA